MKSTRIVFASGNKNKFQEVAHVAQLFGFELLSPKEIAAELSLTPYVSPEEDGSTYLENARIKSQSCFDWCGLPSIGDDSGLEVNALGGAPGIYSARYGGVGLSDLERIEYLLQEFKSSHSTERSARFRCVVSYCNGSTELSGEGILEGELLDELQGERGFGYDPIIKITSLGKTLAEITDVELLEIGFRVEACKSLFSKLV